MKILRELEEALHQFEVRTDPNQLKTLLHDSFIEIGYSGETYNYQTILDELLVEEPSSFVIWSQDYEYIELAPDFFQLIYREARMDENGTLSRHAKRTSLWFNNNGQWQMKYHQGTPTDAFDKAESTGV
ncbi:nuclear transport factor 2 family protein [Photobacterium sp. SDRW27]|uniref:nuclear transport factor 2 family protein n=1 Tax=Photobacterium obscurum TaxID=2829490 RepID=UPI002244630B|nr:nuclear transport factor 2 family protein [Photobacterium obscurum]MCW8328727.1 nuclear transport factor 2 family protein [Photobacterium obscurum]